MAMSGELAEASDILTGAMVARAVEPDAGEGRVHGQGNCLNCGAALLGRHCHDCGQKSHVHRTLYAFFHDFLHSVVHFDGKIWQTLPMLLWRPGDLTRRYVHGERAKFVSPLAMFLFTVFLTFAAFNWLSPNDVKLDAPVVAVSAERQYLADRRAILDDIAKLEADKKSAIARGAPDNQWMDGEIARHGERLKALEAQRGQEIRGSELAARKFSLEKGRIETEIARLENEFAAAQKAGKPTAEIEKRLNSERLAIKLLGSAATTLSNDRQDDRSKVLSDIEFPGSGQLRSAIKHASENPQLLLYKIQSNAYKLSWALIPISLPFMWLLFFWQRRFKMFDHAVFVTYSLTFMMLLVTICAILIQFPMTEVIGGLALALLPPIHMYRQLHQAYETTRFGAFWRMCVLAIFSITALALFAIMIVTLGVTA